MKKCIRFCSFILLLTWLIGCSQKTETLQLQEPASDQETVASQAAELEELTGDEVELQQDDIPVPVETFGSMAEFESAIEQAHSSTLGRSDEKTDDVGLSELEYYFVADRIPEEYELVHIYCSAVCTAYYYAPKDYEYNGIPFGCVPYDVMKIGFVLSVYGPYEDPLSNRMKLLNATERDLLEGKFLLDVRGRDYCWAQAGYLLVMQIPENWDFFVTDVESICHAQTVYVNPPEE